MRYLSARALIARSQRQTAPYSAALATIRAGIMGEIAGGRGTRALGAILDLEALPLPPGLSTAARHALVRQRTRHTLDILNANARAAVRGRA